MGTGSSSRTDILSKQCTPGRVRPCHPPLNSFICRLVEKFLLEGSEAHKKAAPATLAHLIATPERPASLSFLFRFVADERGAYSDTAARVVSYSSSVLALHGSATQIFRTLLLNWRKTEAVILMLLQSCKGLDEFQHELMHLQWCFRLSTLVAVPAKKIRDEISKHFNALEPTAESWSTLVFIRGIAVSCVPDTKETRIKWIDADTLEFLDPRSGKKTIVTRANMQELNAYFATQAEGILDSLDVPRLTPEQLASIVDPLSTSADGDRVSLCHYNDDLATILSAPASIVVKDLESMSRLHTYASVRVFFFLVSHWCVQVLTAHCSFWAQWRDAAS